MDDILLVGDDITKMNSIKSFLDSHFKIKDLGSIHYFLGLKVSAHHQGYIVNQHKFTTDLLARFHADHFSLVVSPLDASVKLTFDLGNPSNDPSCYRRLAGKLNFLQHTRPDITFAVQHLIQFLQLLQTLHMIVALYVL